jgi:hypothetical protein
MPEEHDKKVEEHKAEEKPKRNFPKIKLTKVDIVAIIALIIFVILVAIPTYLPKGNCEVARPDYKCDSLKNVMIENCNYWGNYSCNTQADVSLTQIEWYIGNLCNLQNQYHNSGLDCSNLKKACNQITAKQTCPTI